MSRPNKTGSATRVTKPTTPRSIALHAPHRWIDAADARERFLVRLFDTLWARYRGRHAYVRTYEEVVRAHGAAFRNDHIAFRTLATQQPGLGIAAVARPFEALGYRPAATYAFPDKHLSSIHLAHANPAMPKLFVSELRTFELGPVARRIVRKSARAHRPLPSDALLAALHRVGDASNAGADKLLRTVAAHFERLPWPLPERRDVLALDEESQFGAWVLVNGYDVNHFTALVDSHGVASLGDIDKTVAALREAGVPMKAEIEGAPGSRLRQSSTHAVMRDVAVTERGRKSRMAWSWAYFELAERPLYQDAETGARVRFEGFLGGQATHLFDMTAVQR